MQPEGGLTAKELQETVSKVAPVVQIVQLREGPNFSALVEFQDSADATLVRRLHQQQLPA